MEKNEFYNTLNSMYQEKGATLTLEEVSKRYHCCEKTLRKEMKKSNLYDDCPDVFR